MPYKCTASLGLVLFNHRIISLVYGDCMLRETSFYHICNFALNFALGAGQRFACSLDCPSSLTSINVCKYTLAIG